jgi:hypothetical protein
MASILAKMSLSKRIAMTAWEIGFPVFLVQAVFQWTWFTLSGFLVSVLLWLLILPLLLGATLHWIASLLENRRSKQT